jgi:tetratricopeptide (TPR) repeat protein
MLRPALLSRLGLARWVILLFILVVVLAIPAVAIGHWLYTTRADYLLGRGTAALERGDVAEAERMVRGLGIRGHDSAAHLLRGRILLQQARAAVQDTPRPFPYEGIQQAGQLVLATAGLSDAPAVLRGAAWKAAGLVQQPFPRQVPGADDLRDALQEFVQILDDDPWAAEATVLACECLIRLEKRRPAAVALTALVKRQPDNVDAHRWLAAIFIDLNCPAPAIDELKEWARLDPTSPRPYRWLGFFAREADQASEAIEAYRRALELGAESVDRDGLLQEMAELLLNEGDYQMALDSLDMGSKELQDRPFVLALRAECMTGLGKRDEAVRILDAVLGKHPSLRSALLARARFYLQEDQPQAAIHLLERVILLHPHDPVGRQALIAAYRAIKDASGAAEQMRYLDTLVSNQERLLKLRQESARDPWNAHARYLLALEYFDVSRPQALTWIQSAFACSPDDPRIRKAWTQLVGYQPPTLSRPASREGQR